jgi:RNA polymerase sigma-70 factor (ECF subfamily)
MVDRKAVEDWGAVLEAFKGRDAAAASRLSGIVLAYLARFGAYERRESCQDICQEVLLKLWTSADGIHDTRRLLGWLRTTTYRSYIDWARRSGVEVPTDLPERSVPGAPEHFEELVALREALATLPDRSRRIIEAIYLRGMTFEEAASALGMPEGTLRTLRTEAMKRLRRELIG